MIKTDSRVWQGSLILVNAEHPYHGESARGTLAPVGDPRCGIWMERRAAAILNKLMENIRGWNEIAAVSGWRSAEEQCKIWDDSMRENGEAFTRQYVAAPGCSEHHTGLAIDLGRISAALDFIRPDFPHAGICQRFRRRAAQYGFIERYPAGKERITGISPEPWHFRYVGVPHAEIMGKLELTLEEYHAMLKNFRYGENPYEYTSRGLAFQISYLPMAAMGDMLTGHISRSSRMLSGNNVDGLIITEWGRENDCQN